MIFQRNPIAVRGCIEQCWLFAYRTPVGKVRELLPPQLTPVTHGGFAHWNIVVCRLSQMRPPPLPAVLGLGYWHVAYRLHVRAQTESGPLEGLFFVRSDCDRRLVATAGNALTDFNFHVAGMRVVENAESVCGEIASPDAPASFHLDRKAPPTLTVGSAFASLAEAAEALRYKPFALSPCGGEALNVVCVERKESAWRSRIVTVADARWQFLEGREATLELCYEVEPIEYHWKRGRIIPTTL